MNKLKVKRALVAALVPVVLMAASSAGAAVTTVPQSALTASNYYYTDLIGGGLGPVAVMTGGGNAANVGLASGRNDDGFMGPIPLGFNLSFFGTTYTQFWANNNGNISFTGGISSFIPTGPQGATVPIMSPFFADVDTRGALSGVMHVRTDIANEIIVTWDQVGYYNSHDDKLDSFQLVLRGPDYVIPVGEGAIGFFYKDMQWDVANTSRTAAVGFGDGSANGEVIEGSNQPGMAAVLNNHNIWFDPNLAPVPQVPEPETYALMLLGLGALGLAVRRRKQDGAA
jgi:hypothetical protein